MTLTPTRTHNPTLAPPAPELRAGPTLSPQAFHRIRTHMLLHACKWDPQVGDESTLADFPLLLRPDTWHHLASAATQLTAETLALESALLQSPHLIPELSLPRSLARHFLARKPLTPSLGRILRFDFHPTPDGWRCSEVNSDVPGGYAESSEFSQLFASELNLPTPGGPTDLWVHTLAQAALPHLPIALLAAPGFMEDLQIVSLLARKLTALGRPALLITPSQLHYSNGTAHLHSPTYSGPLGGVIRFYQAEWLSRRPQTLPLFFHGSTPTTSPITAALSESKRLPLLWDRLALDLPAWRHFLPETRPLHLAPWTTDNRWLIKSAYCNTGDTVAWHTHTPRRAWRHTRLATLLNPSAWIAQRRFDILPIQTPRGPMYPCLGVYTVNSQPAGIYARLSRTPIIDFAATDAAVLLSPETEPAHAFQ